MDVLDELANEHPVAVSAAAAGLCIFVGWQLDAPVAGAAFGVVVGSVSYYSCTRGSEHLRYSRHQPSGRTAAVREQPLV